MMDRILSPKFLRLLSAAALAGVLSSPASDLAAQGTPQTPKDKKEATPPTPPGKGGKSEKAPDKGDGKGAEKGGKDAQKAAQGPMKPPGATIPDDPVKRAQLLRDLYALLATAEDQESANLIASSIEHVWAAAVGDTAKVLIERAGKAQGEERPDIALRMLDTVTRIAPDLPEGFNRRAFVYYSINEYERALGDLRRVLALEPNHYKAMEGLGQILRETGQKKAALAVYKKLMAVHPFASGVKTVVEELERDVAGQPS